MADPKGFLNTGRELPNRRPIDVRIQDWKEVYQHQEFSHLQKQAGRCMDCYALHPVKQPAWLRLMMKR